MSSTNYDSNLHPGTREDLGAATRARASVPGTDAAGCGNWFSHCSLVAKPSEWSCQLEHLGVRVFKRPEGLYKALRSRELMPEVCIVDMDTIPRSIIKAVDIRIPCPKIWIGKSAADSSDIKNFGIYYSRARPDEINAVAGRLIGTERTLLLPAAIVNGQLLPLISADEKFRERLHHYAELFAKGNVITLHGDDSLELQLVAQYLAVETQRPRLWDVKSSVSIHTVLRKIAQARRPGTDVTIMLSKDIDTDSAREFYKAMPAEYSMIRLADRSQNPTDSLSFTLPRPAERPVDLENWVNWFACRATIDYGIALSGLSDLIDSIVAALGENPSIGDIRTISERSARQHATIMEDQGQYSSYDDLVHNFERTILRKALVENNGNLSATAKSLGLAESSLRYKLTKLGIGRNQSEDSSS